MDFPPPKPAQEEYPHFQGNPVMMRTHLGIGVLSALWLLVICSSFSGCDKRQSVEATNPSRPPASKKPEKPELIPSLNDKPKPELESIPSEAAQAKQEPQQTPTQKAPVKSAGDEGNGEMPQANQPAEKSTSEPMQPKEQGDEPPGFLPNTTPERKFPFEIPAAWKRLSEKEEIWIDNQEKIVIVSGRICLTKGLLEMFACPKGMKEHESVVATHSMAMYVHQALLLIGVNPGKTVQWEPEYKPAEGPKVQVECWYYNEKNELIKQNAKEMVKLVSDGSTLKIDWVFGGSKFIVDPDGRELYAANGGELICLSNFSSAMIDLPIPSTAEAGGLLFEANSDKIPPLDTPVLLVLKPEKPAQPEKSGQGSGGN